MRIPHGPPFWPCILVSCIALGCGSRTGLPGAADETFADASEVDTSIDERDSSARFDTASDTRDAEADAAIEVDVAVDAGACGVGEHSCAEKCVRESASSCGVACTVCDAPTGGFADCVGGKCVVACPGGLVLSGDACVAGGATPRAIAPLSTTTVRTHRPTLRWKNAPGIGGAYVEICSDRACSTIVQAVDVLDDHVTPTIALSPGVVWWRLRTWDGKTVGAAASPVWEMFVTASTSAVDTSWDTALDMNLDGFGDVAVVDSTGGAVYAGRAGGIDPTPRWITQPTRLDRILGSAGDVNGDGYPDLIVKGTHAVHVYPGGWDGVARDATTTLMQPSTVGPFDRGAVGDELRALGDVDGDGYGDVLVLAANSDSFESFAYVYLGSASGLSTTPAFSLDHGEATGPRFMFQDARAADFDGDGREEILIMASSVKPGASLYLLAYRPPSTRAFFTRIGVGNPMFVGDVDGDGFADALLGEGGKTVSLYSGSAAGLGSSARFTLSSSDRRTALLDLDGDGRDDYADQGPDGALEIAWGDPKTFFGARTSYPEHPMSFAWVLDDVDRDGRRDVAFDAAGGIAVFLGAVRGVTPSPSILFTHDSYVESK